MARRVQKGIEMDVLNDEARDLESLEPPPRRFTLSKSRKVYV
jgi:hypothetical protein